jgi:hypothetical protein
MVSPALGLVLLVLARQAVPPPRPSTEIASSLRTEHRRLLKAEGEKLERLAEAAEPKGVADRAIRSLIERPPAPDGPWPFRPLPEFVPPRSPEQHPGVKEAEAIRQETARSLLALARRAASPGNERFGLATECLLGVLDRDPANREARRLIGYVEHDGGWATPHAAQDLQAGKVLHPTFGWVPADWVPHLEQGELPAPLRNGQPVRWLPAEEADALRRDFAKGWEITTEHFQIRTNVPLAEAISFGRRLEAVRDVFFTLFADVIEPRDLPLAQRFRDPKLWAKPTTKRHQVWYFGSRAEYLAFFEGLSDQSQSLGYYMPLSEAKQTGKGVPRCYFYRDPENRLDATATLFHEASHQLLFESAGPSGFRRNVGHYWIWEGLGTYFETFRPLPDGTYEIGGRDGPRMAKARADALSGHGFIPIADLVGMGELRFKTEGDIHSTYAESMALAVFLMHADRGAYREAFLDYIRAAYRGRLRNGGASALLDRLEVPPAALDERFRRFLTEGPAPEAP